MSGQRSVFKFPLSRDSEGQILLPTGAKFLHFGFQSLSADADAMLWFEVTTDNVPKEFRSFHIFGTGHIIPSQDLVYLQSAIQGPFVWHLYEWKESKT